VAGFPFPNVNNGLHGFIDGAQSVNPDVEGAATYIEAWFDPATAVEAGRALVAAGADVLYAPSFGTIEAASTEGVYAVGDYMDQEGLAPDTVITSALARWDGAFKDIVDAWWSYRVDGTPYDAPLEPIRKLLAEDGCDIAPLNEALVTAEAKAAVTEAREKILSGEVVVEIVDEPVE
jgi:basic membrane lipoprotein Med (substrate-binding protein (PBP1-ABC) superfamily)